MRPTFYIAIDFDGTLTKKNSFPNIGEPNTENIEKISKYIAKKEDECYRVVKILWTCREDIPNGQSYLSDAVSWCDSNVPFKFDYVNENPEITFNHKELVRKIIADVYIDDAAINPFYL